MIKFRGRRIDNGEWIYGSLLDGDIIVTTGSVAVDEDYIGIEEWSSVDPETVGQHTGLKDWNDKEVYEGDILYANGNLSEEYDQFVGVVRFSEESAAYVCGELFFVPNHECIVSGNIHDHPHLLGGAAIGALQGEDTQP